MDTTFVRTLPESMEDKAQLNALRYSGLLKMLAERFHCTVDLLKRVNPGLQLKTGCEIVVPNIRPTFILVPPNKVSRSDDVKKTAGLQNGKHGLALSIGAHRTSTPAETVQGLITTIVSKDDTTLSVLDKNGKLVFHAPVTAGSQHDPLPLGEWKVNGTERYPVFHYNPNLFWDSEATDEKAKIPAGPNNPVGIVWIDISKPHYGIHGTPNPETIGYAESHGCVCLTNWDIKRLSEMTKPGTKVYFVETPEDRLKRVDMIREEISDRQKNRSVIEKSDGEI